MPVIDSNVKAGAVAAGLLAVGMVVGVVAKGDPDEARRTAAVAKTNSDLRSVPAFEPAQYASAVRGARDSDAQLVDLLSPVVEAGQSADVGANFPRGARLTNVEVIGEARDVFVVEPNGKCRDDAEHTWCEVHAVNGGTKSARFTALVRYEVP